MPIPSSTHFNPYAAVTNPPMQADAPATGAPRAPAPAAGTGPRPPAHAGAGQGRGLEMQLRRQQAASSSASSHGGKAARAEEWARQELNAIPPGKLASEFNPAMLDAVHLLAYEKDEKFESLRGKLTLEYALAWLRGKHDIKPAQKRESWAAAPAGLTMRSFDAAQVANVESHGASVVGVHLPAVLGGDGRKVGKTVFRSAAEIDADVHTLCGEVRQMLRNARGSGNPETAAHIAAHFKQNFIAIHPYMDANGRVSRLVSERIFAEFGLPAPDWHAAAYELDMSIDQAAARMLGRR